jgi:hypothetical protein
MDEAGLSELAGVVGAGGAALALLAGRRNTLLAAFALIAAAEVMLADVGRVSPALAAAGLAGLLVLAVGAAVFVRYPALVVPALLVAAPFRLPFDFDRDHRFFFALAQGGKLGRLVPLYVVLAAAVAAYLWRVFRGAEVARIPRLLGVPAAAFFALASLSLLWSRDLDAGANLLAFFLLPFAALVAVVARAELAAWLPKVLAWISIGLASLFAAIGLWQEATEDLFFYSPQLEVANAYSPFFRVTSLFTDPSLYGRHVVLGFAVTLLTGDRVARRAVVAATAVVVLAAAAFLLFGAQDESIGEITSGRTGRVEATADVVREAPLFGVGLGAQPQASQDLAEQNGTRTARFVSHTTPLTVAAELGIAGLAIYALLLAAAIRMILLLRRRDLALALSLGAVLLALFVHALAYSGFFEDPVTWLTLGIGAAYLAAPAFARQPVAETSKPEPAPTGQPITAR